MRNIVAFLVSLLVVASANADAQTSLTVSSQNKIDSEGKISPTFWATSTTKYGNIGFYTWYLSGETWNEAVVGPAFFPVKGVEVDVAVGLESDKNPLRGQLQVVAAKGSNSFLSAVEYGGSGFWYVAVGNHKFNVGRIKAGAGFRAQRYVGIGPRFQIAHGKLGAWVSPVMWDTEKSGVRNSMFGVTFSP